MRSTSYFHWIVAAGLVAVLPASASPHRYDHVVVVIEENHTAAEIVGDSTNAPYMTLLANGGVNIGGMFSLQHPSQPNYLHLFSGSNQGVQNDSLPTNFSVTPTATYPFNTPNLGREMIDAGFTFAGYSEDLEAAGTRDRADFDPQSGVQYRRKHNPWVNWVAKVSPLPPNQIPGGLNKAFIEFPSDFSQLPTLSFVVPNQDHDMHDGSRKQADDWLKAHLDSYARWATTHNSLLIVTWDEDDFTSTNQIPTLFYGAALQNGTTTRGTWTHYHLLRTLEDMYGIATHAGAAAQAGSMVGVFADEAPVTTVTFRQGVNGYAAALDTMLQKQTPDVSGATAQDLMSTKITGTLGSQILLRFDGIFGAAAGLVPSAAVIHSAKLILRSSANSKDAFVVHRMMADWTHGATWTSLNAGVDVNNIEAFAAPSFTCVPSVTSSPAIFDVTSDVEAFRIGSANRGWVITPSANATGDSWKIRSSEYADATLRPALEITWSTPPATAFTGWAVTKGLTGGNNAPEADPDGDGSSNFLEFAFNLNPLTRDATPLPSAGNAGLPAVSSAAGRLTIKFLRRKPPSGSGLVYTPQFSSDLVNWTAVQIANVTPVDANWERVAVADSGPSGQAKRFARVVVHLTP